MNKFRFLLFAFAMALFASTPTLAQTLLLDVTQSLPMAATLDNPCSAQVEAIAFQGTTQLTQKVWLLPTGLLRLQIAEQTDLQGQDTTTLLGTVANYTVSGSSSNDFEFASSPLSIYEYKKVNTTNDLFHSVLIIDFDPSSLKLNLRIGGACEDGTQLL